MNISFINVEDDKIRESFIEVLRKYESLHTYEVVLKQKPIKSSTMQAQPVLSWKSILSGIYRYQIKLAVFVRDSQEVRVKDLPQDVLIGWFAHELGHVVDYAPYSSLQMVGYGLRYLVSSRFKRQAEHAADHIAIQNGFKNEILKTKRFILENDLLTENYKAKIRKYYMSIEEVETWDHNATPGTPELEL